MIAIRICVYADGHPSRGFGHLYRMKSLWERCLSAQVSSFVSISDMDRSFYTKHGMPFSDLSHRNPCDLLIVDTKVDLPEQILEIPRSFTIGVDSVSDWAAEADSLVFPTFYFNKKLLPQSLTLRNVLGGREFTLIRPPATAKHSRPILVTFGGSDPNNITEKVLSILKVEELLKDVTVIIGPGFSCVERIYTNFSEAEILYSVPTTTEYVASAEIVITALGTTLQEIEFFQKKGVVIANYETDALDFDAVLEGSVCPNNWTYCGYFKDIDTRVLCERVTSAQMQLDSRAVPALLSSWGAGWASLINWYSEIL